MFRESEVRIAINFSVEITLDELLKVGVEGFAQMAQEELNERVAKLRLMGALAAKPPSPAGGPPGNDGSRPEAPKGVVPPKPPAPAPAPAAAAPLPAPAPPPQELEPGVEIRMAEQEPVIVGNG